VTDSSRVPLGDWTCPSGNNVEAFYVALDGAQGMLELEWDTPPPLLPGDEAYYLAVIRPAVVRLAAEYTETTGRILVVMP
jgi:hypothetical protein